MFNANAEARTIEFEGEICKEIELDGRTNLDEQKVRENVETNIRRGLPQLKPFLPVDQVVVLCAGGPSLKRYIKNIKRRYDAGQPVVSVNGTHDFLIEHGMIPALHIQLDGRPFNSRFVKNSQEKTRYYIASHSDPSVFDALEGRNVHIFHTDYHDTAKTVLDRYYRGNFIICHGGSTVTLRAIALLTIVGRPRQEIFGFDSCWIGKQHHSYVQTENDRDRRMPVVVDLVGHGRKRFWCAPWMISQADEFQRMVAHMGNNFELAVYGPGLIAHLLKTGAQIKWPQEHGKLTEVHAKN